METSAEIVLLAGVDAFVEHFLHAAFADRLFGLVGEAFAVSRLVVDDGDFLALEMFDDVFAGDLALLVVAAADPEDVPHLALGHRRIGRGRRDLQGCRFPDKLPTTGS